MNLLICCTIGIDAFPYLDFLTKKSLLLDNLMVSLGSQRRMREIFITRSASSKVASLLAKEENPELNLRVFVTGGGCNGFSYGFTFDEEINSDDAVIKDDRISVLVDSMSFPYLRGCEIDYVEDLNGAQFSVKNPNASATCGCGNSFSV